MDSRSRPNLNVAHPALPVDAPAGVTPADAKQSSPPSGHASEDGGVAADRTADVFSPRADRVAPDQRGPHGSVSERSTPAMLPRVDEKGLSSGLNRGIRIVDRTLTERILLQEQVTRRERYVELLLSLTEVANAATTAHEPVRLALKRVCQQAGWEVGRGLLIEHGQRSRFGDLTPPADAGSLSDEDGISLWYSERPELLARLRPVGGKLPHGEESDLVRLVLADGQPRCSLDLAEVLPPERAAVARRAGLRSSHVFPILSGIRCVGVLEFFATSSRSPDDLLLDVIAGIGVQIGHVVERSTLERLAQSTVWTQQERLGKDLYDGVCQDLVGLNFLCAQLDRQLSEDADTPEPRKALARKVRRLVADALEKARSMAKDVQPVEVAERGLEAALHELADATRLRFDVDCRFDCPVPVSIPENEIAQHLYWIAHEGVTGAVRHRKATQINLELLRDRDSLVLQIRDNGRGPGGDAWNPSVGLESRVMRHRASLIDASLCTVTRPNGGSAIRCTLKPGDVSGDFNDDD